MCDAHLAIHAHVNDIELALWRRINKALQVGGLRSLTPPNKRPALKFSGERGDVRALLSQMSNKKQTFAAYSAED